MKHFKQKQVGVLLATCLSLGLFSCSNENELTTQTNSNMLPEIEISRMSMWQPETRNAREIDPDMPVLRFKDEESYIRILNKLDKMSEEEKTAYFTELGFEGAFTLWNQADEELENIFEEENSSRMEQDIHKFKEKYSGMFAFNTTDTYDVTPYFKFTDENLALVGNIAGYVVIGNRLKTAKNMTPTYDSGEPEGSMTDYSINPGPIQPGFKDFKNASLTIKNGKYKSTMTIGRIVNGNSFAVKFITKKKVLFWHKKVKSGYSAVLAMHSSKFNHRNNVFCPYGKEIVILNLPIETVGNVFDADVDNFTSSRGNAKGKQSFKNINVI